MNMPVTKKRRPLWFWPSAVAAAAIIFLSSASVTGQDTANTWTPSDLLAPAQLAKQISNKGPQPLLIHVGFPVLYKGAHLPGSPYAGPGSKPAGLDELAKLTGSTPKGREIVLYCGCCPWDKCPNVRPAYGQLREKGFTNVKVLMIPTNMHTDWVEHGYPIEKGQ